MLYSRQLSKVIAPRLKIQSLAAYKALHVSSQALFESQPADFSYSHVGAPGPKPQDNVHSEAHTTVSLFTPLISQQVTLRAQGLRGFSNVAGRGFSASSPWCPGNRAGSRAPSVAPTSSCCASERWLSAVATKTDPSKHEATQKSDLELTSKATGNQNGSDSEYWGLTTRQFQRGDGTLWQWSSFRPSDCYAANVNIDLDKHFRPRNFGDWVARTTVKTLRIPADLFFQKRYGCRAMMLETVAAVPGMVAGMLLHLRSLRRIEHSGGWIRALLEEAENERMHLMTFMEVSKPAWYERALVMSVQGVFFSFYSLVYLTSPRIAHRIVGFLEEEAVHSYTEFLKEIDEGRIENVAAPPIAIDYWQLPADATLRDVVMVVRADEAHHRDVNHFAANVIQSGKALREKPAPLDYH